MVLLQKMVRLPIAEHVLCAPTLVQLRIRPHYRSTSLNTAYIRDEERTRPRPLPEPPRMRLCGEPSCRWRCASDPQRRRREGRVSCKERARWRAHCQSTRDTVSIIMRGGPRGYLILGVCFRQAPKGRGRGSNSSPLSHHYCSYRPGRSNSFFYILGSYHMNI